MDVLLPVGLAAGAALAVFALFVAVRFVAESASRRLRPRREEPLLADHLAEHLAAVRPPTSFGDRLDRGFERIVGRSSLGLTGPQAAASMVLVAVAAGAAVYLWRPREDLVAAAGALAALLLLVFFWLMHRRWQALIRTQLPDAYHLLARSLRAGLTVDQSVGLIGGQGPRPVADEFRRCAEQLRLGVTLPAALEVTGRRVDLLDFDLLVSVVSMHRDTGGNLALLVDRLGNAVRSRNHFRGHAATVTALGRLTGLVLAMAPFVLLGFYGVVYPDYLARLTGTSQGLNVLMTALILEVVGVVWLSWLLRIDY